MKILVQQAATLLQHSAHKGDHRSNYRFRINHRKLLYSNVLSRCKSTTSAEQKMPRHELGSVPNITRASMHRYQAAIAALRTRRTVLMEKNSLYGERVLGHELKRANALSIDTLTDWVRAEAIMQESVS